MKGQVQRAMILVAVISTFAVFSAALVTAMALHSVGFGRGKVINRSTVAERVIADWIDLDIGEMRLAVASFTQQPVRIDESGNGVVVQVAIERQDEIPTTAREIAGCEMRVVSGASIAIKDSIVIDEDAEVCTDEVMKKLLVLNITFIISAIAVVLILVASILPRF